MDYRIISIGALSCHELWDEAGATRTAHATTTLVRCGDRVILVDPALPPRAIGPRLKERAGIETKQITDVFLTNFRPAHRMGLSAFEHAPWLIAEAEREAVGRHLIAQFQQIEGDDDTDQTRQMLEADIALLKRCNPAPDKLADHVDLFPLPGFTPGTCGLLLSEPNRTTLIASDAVATSEHLEQGRVLRGAYDPEQARESFMEAIEIADILIPGHDNVLMNPTRRPF